MFLPDNYLNIFFKEIINMCKLNGCDNKEKCYSKYGGYCMKHRRNYLVYNNLILHNRFTKRESDYLKKDIQSTIIYIVNYDFLFQKIHN